MEVLGVPYTISVVNFGAPLENPDNLQISARMTLRLDDYQ
jgi:hypothetical protein